MGPPSSSPASWRASSEAAAGRKRWPRWPPPPRPRCSPPFHLLSTAAFDLFFWSAITLVIALRLLRTGDERLWLAIGALAGVGLLNKYNVAFLVVGLVVGLLLVGSRPNLLESVAVGRGGAVALAIWSPNLIWNAQHDWAAFSMLHSLHQENSTLGASISFIPAQFLIIGPVLFPLWFGGLRLLLRHDFARPLAIAYLTLVVLYTVTGAKPYYLGGMYFVLFAAGGAWAERRLGAPAGAARRRLRRMVALWIVMRRAAVAIPLALAGAARQRAGQGIVGGPDQQGPERHRGLAAMLSARSPAWQPLCRRPQRAHLVIFTGDYGAAGAVDLYGGRYGLPHAISGHNSTGGGARGRPATAPPPSPSTCRARIWRPSSPESSRPGAWQPRWGLERGTG